VVLVRLVGHLAEVAGPVADLGARAAGPAVAAGPLLPVVAAEPDWPVAVAAAGVAADLLSQPLAWPLLLVLALWQLAALLLWLLLWLRRQWLSWLLLLLLVQLLLHSAGVLSLCLTVIRFGPCSS